MRPLLLRRAVDLATASTAKYPSQIFVLIENDVEFDINPI